MLRRIGKTEDSDDDGDGAIDAQEAFPLDPNESADTDADGVGNNPKPAAVHYRIERVRTDEGELL
jgi:hypothetical protein